jgi:hypothetical protein
MEATNQLHVLTTLSFGKNALDTYGTEAWLKRQRKNILALPEFEPRSSYPQSDSLHF